MKKSELEHCFEINFAKKLIGSKFTFRSEVVLPGARYRYDFVFDRGPGERFTLEIDGHGMGHTTVSAKARDAEKSNHSLFLGYKPLRLTTKHFRRVQKVLVPTNYAHDLIADICKGVYR